MGDKRKFGLVGLGSADAELGCKCKPNAAGGAAGETDSSTPASFFFGERFNGLGNVDCVGVRAGLRDGMVGVAGSAFCCPSPIMSWYQS